MVFFGSSGVCEKNKVSLSREWDKAVKGAVAGLRRTLEMPSAKGVHGINGSPPLARVPPHLYVNTLVSGPFQSATSS